MSSPIPGARVDVSIHCHLPSTYVKRMSAMAVIPAPLEGCPLLASMALLTQKRTDKTFSVAWVSFQGLVPFSPV